MRYRFSKCLLFFIAFQHAHLFSISMVYNFRIAQITKQPIFAPRQGRNNSIVALVFDQYRKKYNCIRQNFVGGLGSSIYNFDPYYFRIDTAFSHIKEQNSDRVTTFSGTETDDILFTLGRNFILNDRTEITLSGLFGVPTHRIYRLQHTDFGYSQIGTGIQLDGSLTLLNDTIFLYGARYIHFVPRTALDTICQKHTFTLGNIGDILLAHKNTWGKHGLEYGYTFRARFGCHISPHLDDIVQKTNYLRSNFYAVYKYRFLVKNVSHRFLLNIGYGFDHASKVFGNKYIVTLWASWNVRF